MAEEEKYEVRILRERELIIYDKAGLPVPTKEVMYSSLQMTPGIIRIPVAEYSPEERNKRIRLDIEKRLKEKPEIVRL